MGIRKALRRCQQDGRCPSQRSSQRFPWLRIQCRQGGFVDGAGYQTPTQLGCGFLFLARFGERPRGGRSAFYQKYGEKCLNIQIMANTGNNCASTALCLTMSDKCEQSKAEHCRGGDPAYGAPATWRYILRCAQLLAALAAACKRQAETCVCVYYCRT